MLIKNVEVDGLTVDVRIEDGLISEISEALGGRAVVDGQGGALLPGLHDHHIHLNASAAALGSVRCGPPDISNEAELIGVLNQPGEGWLRGIGYHHSVAGEIDRTWLDVNGPDRPVRIQHRGGRMWILNSRAMNELKISQPVEGRLIDGDKLIRIGATFPDLSPLLSQLHSFGITGVTEVTPSNGIAEFENYKIYKDDLRMVIMGGHELSNLDDSQIGPLKLHYHDYDLPSLDELTDEVARAHSSGRAVASHCVTRAEMMLTLAAIEAAGPHLGDRLEHAAIADEAAIEWAARLGLTVVTQPHFINRRGEAYRRDVEPSDHAHLWPLASFARAGLSMAGGSDSPFENFNPWEAMAAAVNRPEGFGQDEEISPEAALSLYTKPAHDAGGRPRKVAVGETADLCLIDRPWAEARQKLGGVTVKAVWLGGALKYSA